MIKFSISGHQRNVDALLARHHYHTSEQTACRNYSIAHIVRVALAPENRLAIEEN